MNFGCKYQSISLPDMPHKNSFCYGNINATILCQLSKERYDKSYLLNIARNLGIITYKVRTVFVEDICSQRDLNPHECKFVFGSDGGQGMFQVTLAIV